MADRCDRCGADAETALDLGCFSYLCAVDAGIRWKQVYDEQ